MTHAGAGGAPDAPELELTVTDLKQWVYCQRIPYYHHVMPVHFARPYPMERGKSVEAAVEAMERRRGFGRYGLASARRWFGPWFRSARMGLSGKLDLLIVAERACYPVDFKDTQGGVRRNHRFQLAAYALLAEEELGLPAPAGFIYLVPTRELVRVVIDAPERAAVWAALAEMRRVISEERLPAPTAVTARCEGCEFRNYCGDIE